MVENSDGKSSMKKTSINLGIIGLGYWGPNFARLCFEVDRINLLYCCDIDEYSLAKIKKQFPSVKVTNNYQNLLKDKNIDAVIVVTPPETHYKLCRNLLIAGKDVLVEKPMTLSSNDAKKLLLLSQKHKQILMVDHIFEYNSGIIKLKELIDKNALGKVFYVSGSYTALGPVRSDVNAILDLAPHHFYILNYILQSKPLWISALGESYLKTENSDVSFITIGYPGNILAKVDVSWLYPFKVRNLVVIGEHKMAFFDDTSPDEKLKIYNKSAFFDSNHPDYPAILKIVYREGDIITPRLPPKEPLKEVLLHFRDCILSRQQPKSGGSDGKTVVSMLEAAQQSLSRKGRRVILRE